MHIHKNKHMYMDRYLYIYVYSQKCFEIVPTITVEEAEAQRLSTFPKFAVTDCGLNQDYLHHLNTVIHCLSHEGAHKNMK
jgi:hypothetical protein